MSEQHYIERYWRDATPADAIKEPPMVARFQDNDYGFWVIGELIYWDRSEVPWYREEDVGYERCQVYDAPDPGEGWRLIDPEKDKPQEDDEIYERETRTWRRRLTPFQSSALSINRRRIEQSKLEPRYEPFRWEDRDQLRGRWIAYDDGNFEVYPTSFFLAESTFFVGTLDAQKLVDHWRFLDTGEPVGRRVE